MKEYQYQLRAHHGMCLAFFVGKGYSNEFTKFMGEMKEKLQYNPGIRIIGQTDIICSACPHNRQGNCESSDKVAAYDKQVLMRCGLSEGEIMPYLDFEKKVYDNILIPNKREEICGDCCWNSLCHF